MTLIIAFGLVALAGLIGAWLLGSRGRDDRSMKTHKETVGTIERIVGRSVVDAGDAANHVRLLGDESRHSSDDQVGGKRDAEGKPVEVHQAAKTRHSVVIPGLGTVPPVTVPPVTVPPAEALERFDVGSPPTQRAVHARSQGRLRGLIPAAAGAVVVISAIVVGATVVSPSSKPGGTPAVSSTGPAPTAAVGVAPLTSVPSTATPAPTTTVVGAATQTAAGYQYQVAGKAVSAVLSVSGSCWLEVRDGSANGPAVFEATLTPGSTKTFSASGGLWLRLGAPRSVQLSLQGHNVTLPGVGGPYDITVVTSTAG